LDEESKELHMASCKMPSCKEVASGTMDVHSTTHNSRAPQYSISNSHSNPNFVPNSRPSPLMLNSMAPLSERQPDLSWWDRSGPLNGLRRIEGTRIAFATSMDNWVDKHCRFDAPRGFVWATQSMYLNEYHKHKDILGRYKSWIHFGVGGWNNYRWKYARKVAFIFSDTFRSQRFVHSGMEVCDVNHVKSIFGLVAESPLMDYDDDKGIVEGFAGLVLLADQEWHPAAPGQIDAGDEMKTSEKVKKAIRLTLPKDIQTSASVASEKKDNKGEQEEEEDTEVKAEAEAEADENENEVVMIEDDAATASTWSSVEETEEQLKDVIQELSAGDRQYSPDFSHSATDKEDKDNDNDKDEKSNSPTSPSKSTKSSEQQKKVTGQNKQQVLVAVNSKTVLSPAAVPYPPQGAPRLANAFAEYTKQQRARLTKNNLEKHTRIESLKHRTQQQVQAQQAQAQQQQQQQAQMMVHGSHGGHPQMVMVSPKVHPAVSPMMSSAAAAHAMSPKSMTRFPKYHQQAAVTTASPTFFHTAPYSGVSGHPRGQMHVLPHQPHHQFPPAVPAHGHGHGHQFSHHQYSTPPMMPMGHAPPPLGNHLSVGSLPNVPNHQ